MCESDRGQWGEVCPDCGQRLPAKAGPLKSWFSTRNLDEELSERGTINGMNSPMNRSAMGRKAA